MTKTAPVWGFLTGFAAGGLVMIALKWLVLRLERRSKGHQRPVGLAAAAAVDTVIDGAIISAGLRWASDSGVFSRSRSGPSCSSSRCPLSYIKSAGARGRARRSRWDRPTPPGWCGDGFRVRHGPVGSSDRRISVVRRRALIYLVAEELLVEAIQAEGRLFQRRCSSRASLCFSHESSLASADSGPTRRTRGEIQGMTAYLRTRSPPACQGEPSASRILRP